MAAKRTYNRDARGRFAGGGGGGGSKGGGKSGGGKPAAKAKPASKPKAPPKTTTARGRARQAEAAARQAVKAGGGSRATRSLLVAQRARDYYRATNTGTKRSRTRPPEQRPTSGIRRTGGLPTVKPASGIRRTTGPRRAPLGGARNAIRTYNPKTSAGRVGQMTRQINKQVKDARENNKKLSQAVNKVRDAMKRLERSTARDIADAKKPGITGEIARTLLSTASSRMRRRAEDIIRGRATRARAAAERGSRPAARALEIYGNQLAFTGSGKPSRSAKNAIKPGPRNTQPPKPKRKPRKPRKPKG